jgi:hypothetical protein
VFFIFSFISFITSLIYLTYLIWWWKGKQMGKWRITSRKDTLWTSMVVSWSCNYWQRPWRSTTWTNKWI